MLQILTSFSLKTVPPNGDFGTANNFKQLLRWDRNGFRWTMNLSLMETKQVLVGGLVFFEIFVVLVFSHVLFLEYTKYSGS